jgi:hypothetical protein
VGQRLFNEDIQSRVESGGGVLLVVAVRRRDQQRVDLVDDPPEGLVGRHRPRLAKLVTCVLVDVNTADELRAVVGQPLGVVAGDPAEADDPNADWLRCHWPLPGDDDE